jgi:hypothetical protein
MTMGEADSSFFSSSSFYQHCAAVDPVIRPSARSSRHCRRTPGYPGGLHSPHGFFHFKEEEEKRSENVLLRTLVLILRFSFPSLCDLALQGGFKPNTVYKCVFSSAGNNFESCTWRFRTH